MTESAEIGVDTEVNTLVHTPFMATVAKDKEKVWLLRLDDIKGKDKIYYDKLKEVCEGDKYIKVFHNAPADIFWLQQIGIRVNRFECSMLASTFVNELLKSIKLPVLVKEYIGIISKKDTILKRLITKYKKIAQKEGKEFEWSQLPRESLVACGLDDAWQSLRLWQYFKPLIQPYYKTYLFEKQVCRVVVWMMSNKILIDRDHVRRMYEIYERNIDIYYKKVQEYLKEIGYKGWETVRLHPQVKVNGLKDVIKFLKWDTGYTKSSKRFPMGQVSSDTRSLTKYYDHPFAQLLGRWRFYVKHFTTYYRPLYHKYTTNTNWYAIFMCYQTGAKTGRFTYELFQTFPKPGESKRTDEKHEVRKCVIPGENHELWCFDMEQEEARVFASFADCKRMLHYFRTGIDVYMGTAFDIFGADYIKGLDKALQKIYRQIAKKPSLGIIYGEGETKLLWSLTVEIMESVPKEVWEVLGLDQKRAGEILSTYHGLYPEIKPYMQDKIRQVYKDGGINLKLQSSRMDIERFYHIGKDKAYIAVNKEVQGASSYVLKYAMLRSTQYIQKHKLLKQIQLTACIHDELMFRSLKFEPNERMEHIKAIKECCEDKVTFKVPLIASVKTSDISWGDCKELVIC